MGFTDITTAGQQFAEGVFGESFTYDGSTFTGVFDWVQREYRFDEFSTRLITVLVCVTDKAQWTAAGKSPANRGVVTYGGITYQIEEIDGADTASDPAFTLTMKKLT